MSAFYEYGLIGIGSSVQIGKSNGRVKSETATKIGLRNAADSAYIDFQANDTTTNNLTVLGNLDVKGAMTEIESTIVTIEDKLIELGYNHTSPGSETDVSADGGGILLKGTTDKYIEWHNAFDSWDSSEHWNLVLGKEYRINNVAVLSSTTLGTTVVNSSLTSVGTITSGVWNGTAVTVPFGGTGRTSVTLHNLLVGNGVGALNEITNGTTSQVLVGGGASDPSFSSINLTTMVGASILPRLNGGTGSNTDLFADYSLYTTGPGGSTTEITNGLVNQYLQANTAANASWTYVSNLRDTNGVISVETVTVAAQANHVTVTPGTTGVNATISSSQLNTGLTVRANGTASLTIGAATNTSVILGTNLNVGSNNIFTSVVNGDILILPNGTGVISVAGTTNYETNVTNDDDIPNKKYVDDAILAGSGSIIRRAVISADSVNDTFNISTPLPMSVAGAVYVSKILMYIPTTVFSGGSVAVARITDGTNILMTFTENNILVLGTYVAMTNLEFNSETLQLIIEFFQIDGTTPAVPTAGSMTITAEAIQA